MARAPGDRIPYHPRVRRALTAILATLAAGCAATPEAPPGQADGAAITVPAADYPRAFDAAIAATRADRLEPVVADRAMGVIETDGRVAGSLLEPWRTDNDGLAGGFAHTVNHERRRARIEFVPEGWAAPVPDPAAPIQAAAIPGTDRAEARFDLSAPKGPVEVHVLVFIDRSFVANKQIGTWSLSQVRYAQDPLDARDTRDDTTRAPTRWTPIGRDPAYERRLADRIRATLAAAGNPADPTAGNGPKAESAGTDAGAAPEPQR